MKYIFSSGNETYCAPVIATGLVSLQIAPDGSMNPDKAGKLIRLNIGRAIFWENKRCKSVQKKTLIPFGRFTQTLGALSPVEADQELDPEAAEITCDTLYPDGTRLRTTAFICADQNLIVLQKTFEPSSRFDYSFTYTLCDANGNPNQFFETSAKDGMIDWKALDQHDCEGQVAVFCDADADRVESAGNSLTFSFSIDSPRTIRFYVLLSDKPAPFADEARERALETDRQGVQDGALSPQGLLDSLVDAGRTLGFLLAWQILRVR